MMNFGSFNNVGVAEAKNGSSKRLMSEISNDMPAGAMSQPRLAAAPPRPGPGINMNVYSTPKLSLALASGLEGKCDMIRSGGESHHGKSNKDDGCESRSGSDNMDGGGSGDDQDGDNQPARKKRYHRHTPQQIQEMEALFKECPHPDEKQRQILSVQLGLAPRQIKFWFQNRRTQMKAQHERHENSILRQENEKLRVDNLAIREAMRNPVCTSCGGPAVLREMSLGEQQLRIENARLRDELDRVCVIAGKFYGRSFPPLTSLPLMHNSSLDLAVGGGNSFEAAMHSSLDPGMEFQQGPSVGLRTGGVKGGMERSMMAELAIAAMDELMKMAQMEEPLWLPSLEDGKETLNYEEYLRQFPRGAGFGSKPLGYKTEATRQVGMVMMNSLNLVETFMDASRCTEMFPCIISRAATVEVISNGVSGTRNGALQLMYMELQVLSPLVPTREVYFLRFSQQHAEGIWAVVDVSVDGLRENLPATLMKCRRRPSGCLIQDMPNGYSKVTWVEHAEYDDRAVHDLYRSLVNSGMAFGSQRWLATLQRQCERLATLMAINVPSRDPSAIPTPCGRRSMLKLAQRMTNNFCAGVSASTVQTWTKLSGNGDDDIRVTTRKSVDDPGEPSGVVLSAATSVWLPVSPQRLFEFLRDERLRSEWDILSNGGPMQEMAHIAKGQDSGNCVSLLGASAMNANQSNMLILQESCTDASGSLVVYAPVDIPAMNLVMSGGDSAYVSLLPSGFAILPDGPECRPLTLTATGSSLDTPRVGGSLLTVAFQILVNSLPTAKLTMESVETVNNLISCTVQKIKSALHCEDA